jgi:hypothetical protein
VELEGDGGGLEGTSGGKAGKGGTFTPSVELLGGLGGGAALPLPKSANVREYCNRVCIQPQEQ